MRLRWVVVLTVIAAAYIPAASAQEGGLSNKDLKASYCLGYFTAQKQAQPQMCLAGGVFADTYMCSPDAREWISADQDAKLKRVLAYLTARDILFSSKPAVSNGFMLANAQGTKDFQQCVKWANTQIEKHTPSERACLSSCERTFSKNSTADHIGELMNCTRGCEPELCRKSYSCENMDYLPR
jgi:hypothetical protein